MKIISGQEIKRKPGLTNNSAEIKTNRAEKSNKRPKTEEKNKDRFIQSREANKSGKKTGKKSFSRLVNYFRNADGINGKVGKLSILGMVGALAVLCTLPASALTLPVVLGLFFGGMGSPYAAQGAVKLYDNYKASKIPKQATAIVKTKKKVMKKAVGALKTPKATLKKGVNNFVNGVRESSYDDMTELSLFSFFIPGAFPLTIASLALIPPPLGEALGVAALFGSTAAPLVAKGAVDIYDKIKNRIA